MASSNYEPMSDDLRRQRRNVILVTVIVWFLKYGDVSITRLGILGIELSLNEPSAIYGALWITWGYFIIRYYQYFRQEAMAVIRKTWKDITNRHCSPTLSAIIHADPRYESRGMVIQYSHTKRVGFMTRRFGKSGGKYFLDIPFRAYWKTWIAATYQFVLNRSVLMDFVFPWVLAAGVFLYANLGDWQGGLLALVAGE